MISRLFFQCPALFQSQYNTVQSIRTRYRVHSHTKVALSSLWPRAYTPRGSNFKLKLEGHLRQPSERLDGARVTCVSFSNPTLVLASLDDGRLAVWQRPAAEGRAPASAHGDGVEQRRMLYNDAYPPAPKPTRAPPSWRQASPAVFSLLRSRMPFPQAGRRGADGEARDITTVGVPWDVCIVDLNLCLNQTNTHQQYFPAFGYKSVSNSPSCTVTVAASSVVHPSNSLPCSGNL